MIKNNQLGKKIKTYISITLNYNKQRQKIKE